MAQSQAAQNVIYRNQTVGEFYADIVVENILLLELKAVRTLASEHLAQVKNYLKATGIEVGFLVNLGNPKLEYRRYGNIF
jgi:GxxExxY protein